MLLYILLTIFVGMLPEIIYFTKFMEYAKNIKEHRIKFFLLMTLAYVLCILVSKYKILYYVAFVFIAYLVMKITYKNKAQIIDIFVFSICLMYLTLISFICSLFIKEDMSNYYIMLSINRITLIIPFIFKNKFNILYNKYKSLWNRNDKIKRPIKSITLRNVSLILLNSFIFITNLAIISIINSIK